MKIITGDLIELAKLGEFNLIGHGCNCQHNFGAGIAKTIAGEFPDAVEADLEVSKPILGDISIGYEMDYDLNIINCYTQIWYGKAFDNNRRNQYSADTIIARYDAIESCLEQINMEFEGDKIGLPLIGCGLAGLKWGTVKEIIKDELSDMDVTIVKYNK